jgi:hypothetical protein
LVESRESRGSARAISAALPPIISVSVPLAAAGAPPESGASTQPMPVSAARRAAISAVLAASMLDMSTSNLSESAPAATPAGPNTALSTIVALFRLVMT